MMSPSLRATTAKKKKKKKEKKPGKIKLGRHYLKIFKKDFILVV